MKKPKFGIVIAVGKSPMGEAYKKAVGKYASEEKGEGPKARMPVAPKGEKDKGPKSRMPVAPKGEKDKGPKTRRRGMEM
jgi:hypothetical protein